MWGWPLSNHSPCCTDHSCFSKLTIPSLSTRPSPYYVHPPEVFRCLSINYFIDCAACTSLGPSQADKYSLKIRTPTKIMWILTALRIKTNFLNNHLNIYWTDRHLRYMIGLFGKMEGNSKFIFKCKLCWGIFSFYCSSFSFLIFFF